MPGLVGLLGLLSVSMAHAASFRAQVVAVLDGDTLQVLGGAGQQRIRLDGIDCPERGQPFGSRARDTARDLVAGRRVRVDTTGTDEYGRLLARVVLPDGRILNRELVRRGLAWWYRRYSDDPVLATLEADARRARRGLWIESSPQPPWEYRRVLRQRR